MQCVEHLWVVRATGLVGLCAKMTVVHDLLGDGASRNGFQCLNPAVSYV